MDPRTFLRPGAVPVATAPQSGQPASGLPVLAPAQPMLVAFHRQVACPFADATHRRLSERTGATPGVIRWAHVPGRAGDLPDRGAALAALVS